MLDPSAVEKGIAEIQQMTSEPEDQEKRYAQRRPVLVNLGDVQPESISWLWPEMLPLGKLTILSGDPGLGKSMITTDIAARLSSGRGWPDGTPGADLGGTVFLSAEDDAADTLRPRFDRAGGDPRIVTLLTAVESIDTETGRTRQNSFSLDDHLSMLDEAIRSTRDCRLVVIDPITAYLGQKIDSHRTSDVRGLLAPLSELAAEHAVAICAVSHLNKSQGTSAIYRSTGSLAFVAAARMAFLCCKDPDDERRRLLLPTKSNLSPRTDGLAFSVQADGPEKAPFVRWEADPVKVTADEALAPAGPAGRESASDEATEFLRDALAAGPVESKRVLADARELGIPTKTLRRALSRLGGKPTKNGFDAGWVWSLPRTIIEDGQDGPLREGQSWASSAE